MCLLHIKKILTITRSFFESCWNRRNTPSHCQGIIVELSAELAIRMKTNINLETQIQRLQIKPNSIDKITLLQGRRAAILREIRTIRCLIANHQARRRLCYLRGLHTPENSQDHVKIQDEIHEIESLLVSHV
jgi:hypothetical protein